eukprot:Tamp_00724.p1 GENE.Tamp_00724~~Tamp_00724.p1  ORF type:complete len:968 (+),score=193.40 Tamp_00724:245-2905(+)
MALAQTQGAKMMELSKLDGGQENMALFFDGSEGTMLTYEGAGEYLAQTVTGGITVEAWVYDAQPAERSGYVAFFQDNEGSAESGGDGAWAGDEPLPEEEKDKGFVLGTDQGAFSFAVASTGTNRLDYLSSQACASRHHVGAWVHVAGTYDGSVMKLYIDGVLSAEAYTQQGPIAWPTSDEPAELTLGAWLGTKEQTYFHGMLDEARIWAKPLSAAEIQANMHVTLALPVPGLAVYLRFDRSYCDEVNWMVSKVAYNPNKDEMDLVSRVPSGADVELMSVSWACLAECEPMAAPLHGSVLPEAIMHEGDMVSIYCDSGYEARCADGSSDCTSLTCQNDGEGNGVYEPEGEVTCIGMCGAYPGVYNGQASPADHVYVGDMVDITCDDGYEINDPANSPATCVEGGKGAVFDNMAAACIAACEAYPAVEHGSVEPSGPTRQNDEVTITCDEGYELITSYVSGSPATCIDGGAKYGGGIYDKPAAECRAKCAPYPAVEHGQISPAGPVFVNEVVSIACKSGYVLGPDSPLAATCVDTGSGGDFDAFGASCVAVCTAFPSVENGAVFPAGEVHAGDTVSVVCDEGYKLEGNAASFVAECVDSGLGGEYNKGPPVCVEEPVYCEAPTVSNAYVSPNGDVLEGETVTVTCHEGYVMDEDAPSTFVATCIKNEEAAAGDVYGGVFDQAMPTCVPEAPEPLPDEVEMSSSAKGLNSECAKWRDNKDGKGKDLSLQAQLRQFAYCMQQDCAQSMEQVTCRYTDGNRLCYTNVGQIFCKEHVPHSMCQDLGEAAGDPTNLVGDGAWAPRQNVPVFGSASLIDSTPYNCLCLKNCAHYTGSSLLKKYRCTGGDARMVGQIEGSSADKIESISSSTKNGQCACSCGHIGVDNWEAGNPQ